MDKTKRAMMAKIGWVEVPDQKPGIYRREHFVDNRYPSDWMHVPAEMQREFEAYKKAKDHDD
jgi:hypothetical protein